MNDYNYDYNPNPEPPAPEPAHSGMETAAIILGILALMGSTCFYLSIPCAGRRHSSGRSSHEAGRSICPTGPKPASASPPPALS